MKTIEEIYKEWRWLTYNKIDKLSIEFIPNQQESVVKIEKNFEKKSQNNYSDKNFEVSEKQINNYDANIRLNAKELTSKYSLYYYGQFFYLRSIFIENCFIKINEYNNSDLLQKIKRNIIYYHWWDELSFDELSQCIIETHFLNSTSKLLDKESLFEYFKQRFTSKEEFINYLLKNFIPKESMIKEMNSITRSHVIFDYSWLFDNELKKSIRIFENECRLEFKEKIIGSFYNETILFREIKNNYENKFAVISQGSPEWLNLQRFDIYFPELNIAIEYQGEQHQYPVDFGGKGKKIAKQQFEENLKRDLIKQEKATQNNCEILYIYPNYDIKNVLFDLDKMIKQRIINIT